MSPPVVIRTMMGAGNLELSLKCLGRIRKFCRHELVFHIHEDGTLDAPLRARLQEALGTVTFQDRAEANALMEGRLRAHPHCRAFRHRHIMAMQVLYIPMFAPATGRVVYTDTDILYTRPLECPDFFLDGGLPFTGSQDVRESYAVHLTAWPLLRKLGVQLASRSCGGMTSFEPAVHDLDCLEWLFQMDARHGIFAGYPFFVPQTLFAALAAPSSEGGSNRRNASSRTSRTSGGRGARASSTSRVTREITVKKSTTRPRTIRRTASRFILALHRCPSAA